MWAKKAQNNQASNDEIRSDQIKSSRLMGSILISVNLLEYDQGQRSNKDLSAAGGTCLSGLLSLYFSII